MFFKVEMNEETKKLEVVSSMEVSYSLINWCLTQFVGKTIEDNFSLNELRRKYLTKSVYNTIITNNNETPYLKVRTTLRRNGLLSILFVVWYDKETGDIVTASFRKFDI